MGEKMNSLQIDFKIINPPKSKQIGLAIPFFIFTGPAVGYVKNSSIKSLIAPSMHNGKTHSYSERLCIYSEFCAFSQNIHRHQTK